MVEINNKTKQKIALKKTERLVESFLALYKQNNWEVSIAIIGDQAMRRLNRDYRKMDRVTDVLSFPGGEFMGKKLGEVIININETQRAYKYRDIFEEKPSVEYLFNFLLIHGLLHLIGYNDKTEKGRQEMLSLGKKFMRKCL